MLRKYDLQHSEIQQFSLYNDGNLAILDRITDFARQLDRNPEAAITADFYTLILCLKDEISFLYDDIQMHIVPQHPAADSARSCSNPSASRPALHVPRHLHCPLVCQPAHPHGTQRLEPAPTA